MVAISETRALAAEARAAAAELAISCEPVAFVEGEVGGYSEADAAREESAEGLQEMQEMRRERPARNAAGEKVNPTA